MIRRDTPSGIGNNESRWNSDRALLNEVLALFEAHRIPTPNEDDLFSSVHQFSSATAGQFVNLPIVDQQLKRSAKSILGIHSEGTELFDAVVTRAQNILWEKLTKGITCKGAINFFRWFPVVCRNVCLEALRELNKGPRLMKRREALLKAMRKDVLVLRRIISGQVEKK